jgi:CheY-like chemotaxis protein
MNADRNILVAEDDEIDVLLLRRAFEQAGVRNGLRFVHDGQAAIEFLSAVRDAPDDRLPALVILDLKMPRRTGIEVLQWIAQDPVLRCVPVIIFSSSAHREDIERAYALGANAFIVKPASTVQRAEVARFIKDWMHFNEPPLVTTEGFKAAQSAHAARRVNQVATL